MSNSEFDVNQYKINQRRGWNSVATGWQKWWETFERGGQRISDKLVELAKIKPEQRVLDVATGIGEPAVTAARAVGNTGRVIATDISAEMLAIGRERAHREGLTNIEFKESDLEALDLPNSYFDAALCRWGLMFLPNISIGLRNIHKTLVSEGKLAAAVWAEPIKVPQLDLAISTAREQLQLPPPPPDMPGPFSLADFNKLKISLLQAGFSDILNENIQVTFDFESAEDYVRFTQEIAAPVNVMLANETEERKAKVWDAITDRVKTHYTKDDGKVKLDNEAICIAATRR